MRTIPDPKQTQMFSWDLNSTGSWVCRPAPSLTITLKMTPCWMNLTNENYPLFLKPVSHITSMYFSLRLPLAYLKWFVHHSYAWLFCMGGFIFPFRLGFFGGFMLCCVLYNFNIWWCHWSLSQLNHSHFSVKMQYRVNQRATLLLLGIIKSIYNS